MLSTNHQYIWTLYFTFSAWARKVGTSLRILIRGELGHPGAVIGDDQICNVILTVHAVVIIFLIVIPIIIGGFGSWLVPLFLGATDMAFTRINNKRFWLLPPALTVLLVSSIVENGKWKMVNSLSSFIFRDCTWGSFSGLSNFSLYEAEISSILGALILLQQ